MMIYRIFSPLVLYNPRTRSTNVLVRYFYDATSRSDTIFAPSSKIDPTRGSPLGVIRVSGDKTRQLVKEFLNRTAEIKPRQATLAKIFNPKTKELIDIGLILWFPKPNSYTGEDVCEFHLHGSHAIMAQMLDSLGSIKNVRPAEAGEFTRRAVMNQKMSLVEAESLPDLIASMTDNQRRLALSGLSGSTRIKYETWTSNLIALLAHLEASIDFGEDELIGEQEVVKNCIDKLALLAKEIEDFIHFSRQCREFVQAGFKIVILGKPNAGKSTFMNLISKREKSIVSDLSGTTRDIIEHSIELGGHMVTLYDTAGLRDKLTMDSEDVSVRRHLEIEQEGIKRALEVAKASHVIIYLVDVADLDHGISETMFKITEDLRELTHTIDETNGSKKIYLVLNKIDLISELTNCRAEIVNNFDEYIRMNNFPFQLSVHLISCHSRINFKHLVQDIISQLDNITKTESAVPGPDELSVMDYVNERHLTLLKSTSRNIQQASIMNIKQIDEMAQHVRESVDYLSRIVGTVSNEQVFDIIFRDFCIGK